MTAALGRHRAIMGDTIAGGSRVRFTTAVLGARQSATPGKGAYVLLVQRNGTTVRQFTVGGTNRTFHFRAARSGRWGLVLMHGKTTAAVSTPIWVTR
jgi:hypothetical protein